MTLCRPAEKFVDNIIALWDVTTEWLTMKRMYTIEVLHYKQRLVTATISDCLKRRGEINIRILYPNDNNNPHPVIESP